MRARASLGKIKLRLDYMTVEGIFVKEVNEQGLVIGGKMLRFVAVAARLV